MFGVSEVGVRVVAGEDSEGEEEEEEDLDEDEEEVGRSVDGTAEQLETGASAGQEDREAPSEPRSPAGFDNLGQRDSDAFTEGINAAEPTLFPLDLPGAASTPTKGWAGPSRASSSVADVTASLYAGLQLPGRSGGITDSTDSMKSLEGGATASKAELSSLFQSDYFSYEEEDPHPPEYHSSELQRKVRWPSLPPPPLHSPDWRRFADRTPKCGERWRTG